MGNGKYRITDILKIEDHKLHPNLVALKETYNKAETELGAFNNRIGNPNGYLLNPKSKPSILITEQNKLIDLVQKAKDALSDYLKTNPNAVLKPAQTAPNTNEQSAARSAAQAARSRENDGAVGRYQEYLSKNLSPCHSWFLYCCSFKLCCSSRTSNSWVDNRCIYSHIKLCLIEAISCSDIPTRNS